MFSTALCSVLLSLSFPMISPVPDVDWRVDFMSSVVDVGSCGGAMAPFAVLGALEWHVGQVTGRLIPLSAQYLVDCEINDVTGESVNVCDAEDPNSVMRKIMREQYLPLEEDYNYLGNFKTGRCQETGARSQALRNALADVWVHGFTTLGQTSDDIKGALQSGPIVDTLYAGDIFHEQSNQVLIDKDCEKTSESLVVTFVGWYQNGKNPYYIVRGVDGERVGHKGYFKYADNNQNFKCGYTRHAFSLNVERRREIEYKVGHGKVSFKEARRLCQSQPGFGWDLAHIPTEKHNQEVYDLFTDKWGSDKKSDATFNYFWIGLFDTKRSDDPKDPTWVWVDGDWDVIPNEINGTGIKYSRFDGLAQTRFGAMRKVNTKKPSQRGSWVATQPNHTKLRFVCSRYRSESCPRISHTAVENAYKVTFIDLDGEESLEIVEGSKTQVECMKGYKLKGGKGVCRAGNWRKMPRCVTE